jgi:hypothetical protein
MFQVVISFATAQEAANFLLSTASGVTGHGTAAGMSPSPPTPNSTMISPSSPQPGNAPPPGGPPPSAPPAAVASPPPMAAPPAPPTSAPPPAPPPAPAAAPANGLQGEVLTAMQNWSKAGHKAAGIKRVLTKAGIASVSAQTPSATLEWLKWAFSPQPDGSYLTPEYIESLQ